MHIKDLIESLPKSSEKNTYDNIDLDNLSIHASLVAALNGQPRPIGLKPLAEVVKLDETKPKARLWDVVIPEGTHEKLAEAISGPSPAIPAGMHERLAKALR